MNDWSFRLGLTRLETNDCCTGGYSDKNHFFTLSSEKAVPNFLPEFNDYGRKFLVNVIKLMKSFPKFP